MLVLDDMLVPDDQELLIALDRYLASRGVAVDRYLIAAAGSTGSAEFVLRYGDAAPQRGLGTVVEWPMADATVRVHTRLANGIRLLAMLLGENFREHLLIPSTLGPRDSLAKLGISYVDHWSNNLAAPADTLFLAPSDGAFVMAYMDERPPADIQSWSRSAACLAVQLALAEREEAAGIAATLAQFLP